MRLHIERARGSLLESVMAVRLGRVGYVSQADGDAVASIADNLCARLYGLPRR